jgi:hypothetical protein
MQERHVAPALVDIYMVLLKGNNNFYYKKYNILLSLAVVVSKIVFSLKLKLIIDLVFFF